MNTIFNIAVVTEKALINARRETSVILNERRSLQGRSLLGRFRSNCRAMPEYVFACGAQVKDVSWERQALTFVNLVPPNGAASALLVEKMAPGSNIKNSVHRS